MTIVEIAKRVGERADIPEGQAVELVEWVLELMKTTLQRGEDIVIVGLGQFRVRSKNARAGRNPRTGQEITISTRRVVTFQASGLFKEYVAGTKESNKEPSARLKHF